MAPKLDIHAKCFPSVKTGKSLRAIETYEQTAKIEATTSSKKRVKTGKSLRAIAEIWE